MSFRDDVHRNYQANLEKQAMKATKKLMKRAAKGDTHVTVDVYGELRAQAYMAIGWHPVSDSRTRQQWRKGEVEVPCTTLTIEVWD